MRYFYAIVILILFTAACKKDHTPFKTVTDTKTNLRTIDSVDLLHAIQFNGAVCPVDSASHTFYFPVGQTGSSTSYKLTFDTTLVNSIAINNTTYKNNTTIAAFSLNQQLKLQITDVANHVYSGTLVVTGFPILNLYTGGKADSVSVYSNFELVDADYTTHKGVWLVQSKSTMKLHGGTSTAYPKKSYQLSTINSDDLDLDVSLLGMRTDQNWILDAMYIDQARMRNRLCTDLWNTFNNVPYIASEPTAYNGTHGYMIEVITNDSYQGVYCLTEKLDRKQIQAKKTYGVMYKSDAAEPQTAFDFGDNYNDALGTWDGWEFTYPDLGDSPAPTWKYLNDFATFVSTSTDAQFSAGIPQRFYTDNMVDYYLFINVIAGIDNVAKNQYLSFYDSRSDTKFFYSPWDMDGTFGRSWDGSVNADYTMVYGSYNNLFARMLSTDADNFKEKLKARWNALKTSQLSKATVAARINYYAQQLISTNAGEREMAKWGNITQGFDSEAAFMVSWYNSHYDWVDQYINGL